MSRDLSYDYLTAIPVGQAQRNNNISSNNNSKIENYKRIKQEEAAARALLMAPAARALEPTSAHKARNQGSELGGHSLHKRNPSHLGYKYKPSENALASYSPLRSQLSQQALPQFVQPAGGNHNNAGAAGLISSVELRGLRQII